MVTSIVSQCAGIFEGIEAHSAPITAVRFHPIYKNSPREISDLFLSSSYDWTVKLWSSKMSRYWNAPITLVAHTDPFFLFMVCYS